jgi:hypothetical protein
MTRLFLTYLGFVSYFAGAEFDNLVFLPRGAYILGILPNSTQHSPLYPSLAARTGKEFARYVNDDLSLQRCWRRQAGEEEAVVERCESRQADLQVSSTHAAARVLFFPASSWHIHPGTNSADQRLDH